MAEEMRTHLEEQTLRNVAAGMNETDARAAARRQFGGVDQVMERARDQRGWVWLDHVARDTAHGWRMITKAPLLSAVIVLSLGIGVGVNAVIFSWIRSLMFRPIPGVADATQFRLVEPKTDAGSYPGASWTEYLDLRDRLRAFDRLLAFKMLPLDLGEPGNEERVYSQLVSGNYFSALGLRPAAGRFLREDEATQPGAAPVVVISKNFWRTRFGGSPDVLGQELKLNGQSLTVIGVAPEGFHGTVTGLSFDLWVPATMAPVLMPGSTELTARDIRGYSVMGVIRPGATLAQAQTELDVAMGELAANFPASNGDIGAEAMPFWRTPRGAGRLLLGALAAMQGFMVLVLLVVCVNAANLLLARSTTRRREIGVRLALGARPRQILRLLLTESILLGAAATVLGGVLATWGTTAVRAVPLPGQFPFHFETGLEASGLAFTGLLGIGCAVVFGLAPALQAARTDSHLALRVATVASGRRGFRHGLVAMEVALSLLVLVVASLFLQSFLETRTTDPGFRTDGVLLAVYDLSRAGYDKPTGLTVTEELLQRLRASPQVEAAAIASWVPLDFHPMPLGAFKIDGRERSDGGRERALTYTVTPGYFDLMKIPLVAGRDFVPLTDKAHGSEIIVNEEFARRFFAGASPLGHQLGAKGPGFEVVGVVRNALYETFGEPPKPIMYISYRDWFRPAGQIHVRTRGAETAFAPALRRIARDVNPDFTLYDVRTLNEHVDKNLFFRRIPARIFAVLGPVILLLAAVGIYAVVAYAVAQRTAEIGIRLALGASPRRVVREILRESMRVVCVGAVPAWLLSLVVMLHLRGGVLNLTILVGVPGILLTVASLAAWLPARRAAKVDPIVALRAE